MLMVIFYELGYVCQYGVINAHFLHYHRWEFGLFINKFQKVFLGVWVFLMYKMNKSLTSHF